MNGSHSERGSATRPFHWSRLIRSAFTTRLAGKLTGHQPALPPHRLPLSRRRSCRAAAQRLRSALGYLGSFLAAVGSREGGLGRMGTQGGCFSLLDQVMTCMMKRGGGLTLAATVQPLPYLDEGGDCAGWEGGFRLTSVYRETEMLSGANFDYFFNCCCSLGQNLTYWDFLIDARRAMAASGPTFHTLREMQKEVRDKDHTARLPVH